jgi:hypothetical protein
MRVVWGHDSSANIILTLNIKLIARLPSYFITKVPSYFYTTIKHAIILPRQKIKSMIYFRPLDLSILLFVKIVYGSVKIL